MGSYGETALVHGLSFLAEKQAAIANNLANVDTTSFKRRAATAVPINADFDNLLDEKLTAIGYIERSDMRRGVLRETGNRFDLAIDGEQWLRVRDSAGREYYTRNGQVQISPEGYLTTRDGMQLLDKEGEPMMLGAGGEAPTDLAFSPNGTVTDPSTGRSFGTLALVTLPTPEALVPIGGGRYVDPTNQTAEQAADGLRQGFLESSNVDSLQELVEMISVERTFSATQKALTGLDTLQKNLISNMLR